MLAGKDFNQVGQQKDNISLIKAVKMGNEKLVRTLLATGNFDKAESVHDEALFTAIKYGQVSIASWLLSHKKCNKHFICANNNTALMTAIKYNRMNLIHDFICSVNVDINAVNRDGDSALIFAVANDNEESVALLLTAPRIDINLTNHRGDCAFSLAVKLKHYSIIAMLLKAPKLDQQIMWSTLQRAIKNHDAFALGALTHSILLLTHAAIDSLQKTHPCDKALACDDDTCDATASLSVENRHRLDEQKKTHPSTSCLASNHTLSEMDSARAYEPEKIFDTPFLEGGNPYFNNIDLAPISHGPHDAVNDYMTLPQSATPCDMNSPVLGSGTVGWHNNYESPFNHEGMLSLT